MNQASSFPPSLQMVFRPGRPGLKTTFLAAAALLAAGCGPRVYLINTIEKPLQIVVDGETDDWSSGLSYVPDHPVLVGFLNDGDNLYVCLKRDQAGERQPGGGLSVTVWFDPSGGTNKVLGIKLGGRPPGGKARPGEPGQEPPAPPDGRIEGPPDEVEIISANKDLAGRMSFEQASEKGLEIKSDVSGRSFVLEMKIPLRASAEHPLAAGIAPGAAIGIGIITEVTKPENPRGGPSGGSMGGRGGMPGGGGMTGGPGVPGGMGGPGGMPGGRGGMNIDEESLKPVKIWIKVQTAAVRSGGSPLPCPFVVAVD